ncbi:MAG: hypothetical protein ACHQNT_00025 [Bacteroidia bacterium]
MHKLPLCFCLFFLIVFSNHSFSQGNLSSNSSKKLNLSVYFTPAIFYLEPGIAFQYFIKNDNCFYFNYGYQIVSYNINNTGKHDLWGITIEPGEGHGHIFKLGYKLRTNFHPLRNPRYLEFRISYKDLYFPPYYHSDDSPGLTLSYWYRQSEKRQVYLLNLVFTSEILSSKYFTIDFTKSLGIAFANYEYTKFSSGPSWDMDLITLSPPEITKENLIRPSIGIGFTLNFKVYQK